MLGNFSWDATARILTTDDFSLGYWAANGVGFQLGENIASSYGKAVFSGDGNHGETRMEGGNAMIKCTAMNGVECWKVDTGEMNFGVTNEGDIRIRRTDPATTPGNIVRRLQVFSADGVSLGYIPIYDTLS